MCVCVCVSVHACNASMRASMHVSLCVCVCLCVCLCLGICDAPYINASPLLEPSSDYCSLLHYPALSPAAARVLESLSIGSSGVLGNMVVLIPNSCVWSPSQIRKRENLGQTFYAHYLYVTSFTYHQTDVRLLRDAFIEPRVDRSSNIT